MTRSRRPILFRECQIKGAPEEAVRRLARYCGVDKWDSIPIPNIIDELAMRGIVYSPWMKGMY